jgi:hypothetical protein
VKKESEMKRTHRNFGLSFVGIILAFWNPSFSMAADADLYFDITDKQGRSFIVRPMEDKYLQDVQEMEKVHAKKTPEYLSFVTTETSDMVHFFSFERRFVYERTGNTIENRWIFIEANSNKIVGQFDYSGNEATSLIHPDYRGLGIGTTGQIKIHEYLREKMGTKSIAFTEKEGDPLFAETEGENEYNRFGELMPQIDTYEKFVNLFLSHFNINEIPYKGYIATVAPQNVASLRMCLATGMLPTEVDENRWIKFSFSANTDPVNADFLAQMQRLTIKDPEERQRALEEFDKQYPYPVREQDAAGDSN